MLKNEDQQEARVRPSDRSICARSTWLTKQPKKKGPSAIASLCTRQAARGNTNGLTLSKLWEVWKDKIGGEVHQKTLQVQRLAIVGPSDELRGRARGDRLRRLEVLEEET